ncbi:NUDIX hydrolase [Streptomyces sp. YIM 98790]|uniref:NUDIX hydrolase n=1 Tax=Streptomyces sp. YIM 98790 TaxID=2689077 RepID=UPI001FB5CD58|nr:NUDIX hydrolase [Streptomyces sp. YIM 98790]
MGRTTGPARGRWTPPDWPERIRALARGELTPAVPRRAATVLLLRDTPAPAGRGGDAGGGLEVHLIRRRTSMAFAGGAHAYPGGGVDPRDEGVPPRVWAGPGPAEWAARLGTDPASARAIVCAVVRETFEEAGVLLAGGAAGGPAGGGAAGGEGAGTGIVPDTSGEEWEADRLALVSRELSFGDFLLRRRLAMRTDLLGAWARWITPEFEERRYDTWFFVAALPAGQRTRQASTESDRALWLTPGAALRGYEAGEMLMMPPTVATLRRLAGHRTVAAALAAAAARPAAAEPVLARVRPATAADGTGELVVSWPGHAEFEYRIPRTGPGPGTRNGTRNGTRTRTGKEGPRP